tara:strand:+ start:3356 stop:5062 length:1707 start_codon:yes stop_codon:yes gene_type:complete
MELPSESNTLAASVIFLGSIVVDAIAAKDPMSEQNAPTSLRTAAMVLIAILSAPPIRQWMVFQQRVAVGVALSAVALTGWHEQSIGARVCDAIFIITTLGIAMLSYHSGGEQGVAARKIKSKSKDAPPYLRRESLINLAVSQLFYSSFRILRMALRHPQAVYEYSVMVPTYNGNPSISPGYAYASAAATASLAFGAAAGIGLACVMLVDTEVREHGTSAATLVLTTAAFAQLTGAFIATMAFSEQVSVLTGIFSSGACNTESICKPAFLARRFALTNSNSTGLWMNGFGTLILAFAPSLRMKSRKEMETISRNFELTVYSSAFFFVCVCSLLVYLSFTGAESITDYAAVAATLAVVVTAFLDNLVGAIIFLVAVGADIIMMWSTYGGTRIFGHFTYCTNAVMLLLLALYVVITTIVDFSWRLLSPQMIELADRILGVLVIAGTSLGVLLYLASCALQASYTGLLVIDSQYRAPDNRYERTSASFIMEHYLPVLVWLPLYSCRCEVELLGHRTRAACWYLASLVPTFLWLIVVAAVDLPTWANAWYGSSGFVILLGAGALVPWATVVWA